MWLLTCVDVRIDPQILYIFLLPPIKLWYPFGVLSKKKCHSNVMLYNTMLIPQKLLISAIVVDLFQSTTARIFVG